MDDSFFPVGMPEGTVAQKGGTDTPTPTAEATFEPRQPHSPAHTLSLHSLLLALLSAQEIEFIP